MMRQDGINVQWIRVRREFDGTFLVRDGAISCPASISWRKIAIALITRAAERLTILKWPPVVARTAPSHAGRRLPACLSDESPTPSRQNRARWDPGAGLRAVAPSGLSSPVRDEFCLLDYSTGLIEANFRKLTLSPHPLTRLPAKTYRSIPKSLLCLIGLA